MQGESFPDGARPKTGSVSIGMSSGAQRQLTASGGTWSPSAVYLAPLAADDADSRRQRLALAMARAAREGDAILPVRRPGAAQAEPIQRRPPAVPRPRTVAWLSGLLGFGVGIVFWHLIGFWGFVHLVVLPPSGPERSRSAELPAAASGLTGNGGHYAGSLPMRHTLLRVGRQMGSAAGDTRGEAWAATVTEVVTPGEPGAGLTDR